MQVVNRFFKRVILQDKPSRTYELSSGSNVVQPVSYTPLVLLILFVMVLISWDATNINLFILWRRFSNFFDILLAMDNPNWNYLVRIQKPMLDTIQMSFLGSLSGSVLALPVAFLASNNINKNKVSLTLIRFVLSIFRTLPVLVYAAVLALIFGFGTLAGTVAIAMFTFALMSKMLYEVIETIDLGAYTAVEATGSSKPKAFITAVLPQISASYISLSLYSFEINIRYAAILGWVGAGGIGLLMDDRMSWRSYNDVFVILFVLFVIVVSIEQLSRYIRKRLG